MFKNILIPLDGSKNSREALKCAIFLAKRFNARLKGLHVIDIVQMEGPMIRDIVGGLGFEPFVNLSARMKEVLEEKASDILNFFKEECERENIESETVTASGIVASEISTHAKTSDLIVMGKRGVNEGFEYNLLGSVTEGVLKKSKTPLVVVPEKFIEPKKALLAMDNSENSGKALKLAGEVIKNIGATLTVATVKKDIAVGEEILSEAKDYLKSYDIEANYERLTNENEPYFELEDYYNNNNFDLFFIGATRRNRLSELILGSVTEHVLRSLDGLLFIEK